MICYSNLDANGNPLVASDTGATGSVVIQAPQSPGGRAVVAVVGSWAGGNYLYPPVIGPGDPTQLDTYKAAMMVAIGLWWDVKTSVGFTWNGIVYPIDEGSQTDIVALQSAIAAGLMPVGSDGNTLVMPEVVVLMNGTQSTITTLSDLKSWIAAAWATAKPINVSYKTWSMLIASATTFAQLDAITLS